MNNTRAPFCRFRQNKVNLTTHMKLRTIRILSCLAEIAWLLIIFLVLALILACKTPTTTTTTAATTTHATTATTSRTATADTTTTYLYPAALLAAIAQHHAPALPDSQPTAATVPATFPAGSLLPTSFQLSLYSQLLNSKLNTPIPIAQTIRTTTTNAHDSTTATAATASKSETIAAHQQHTHHFTPLFWVYLITGIGFLLLSWFLLHEHSRLKRQGWL